jgi:hypothetical protein
MNQRNSIIFAVSLVILIGGFTYLMASQEKSSLRQASLESALENVPVPSGATATGGAAASPSAAAQPATQSPNAQPQAEAQTAPPSSSTPTPPTAQDAAGKNDPASPTNASSTSNNSSIPDTSSWQTWKSAQFGAEMKYPAEYSVSEDFRNVTLTKGNITWKIRFYSNKDKSSFQTWYAGYFPAKDNNACNFAAGTLKVGTLSIDKVTLNSAAVTTAGSSPKCDAAGDYAISADSSQVVRVNTDKATSDMTTVNQMLETFKFDTDSAGA